MAVLLCALFGALGMGGCSTTRVKPQPPVSPDELKHLWADYEARGEEICFIDMQNTAAYARKRIPGAMRMSLVWIEPDERTINPKDIFDQDTYSDVHVAINELRFQNRSHKYRIREWQVVDRLSKAEHIVVYAESDGNDLAEIAVQQLWVMGYARARLLRGGITAWESRGGTVEATPLQTD
jgi:3-mercaptopyruvate sulfurtransferase SseA